MIDRQSFFISAVLHFLLLALLLIGMPSIRKEVSPTRLISVSMVPIDSITQSPQRAQKKIPPLSSYKKPTYKMGKPLTKKEPVIKAVPVPVKTNSSSEKIVALKSPKIESEIPKKTIEEKRVLKETDLEQKSSPAPKNSPDPFDSVLQSVQQFEKPTDLQKKSSDPRAFDTDLISNKISVSELDALRQQLQQCWLVPPTVMSEKDLIVEAAIDLDIRGMVTDIKILNLKDGQKFRSFREAVQSVRQALRAPECSPLKLPADKYHQWKKCVLRFSPRGIE